MLTTLTNWIPQRRTPTTDVLDELERRRVQLALPDAGAFEIALDDGRTRRYGTGAPAFAVAARDAAGSRALGSFDDLAIAEAYLHGNLDITGDLYELLRYRPMLSDRRPLQYVWETYLQSLLRGQAASDKQTIPQHYDLPAEFFTLWLDRAHRAYSHGFFARDDESLEAGMARKLEFAYDACRLQPGMRVLDIGGGWGSFLEYAGKRGVRVSSVTISKASAHYMRELIARENLPCEVIEAHLLELSVRERFDAIVNLGVTEHLPDYRGTLAQYDKLLVPGGRIYLDSYTGPRFNMSSFVTRWVYEGNTSPLCLERYLQALARTDFEVMHLASDSHNYYLTCRKWAENLDRAAPEIIARFGELLYRRFRLYLWGCARAFADGSLSAHHLVLEHRPGLREARRLFKF